MIVKQCKKCGNSRFKNDRKNLIRICTKCSTPHEDPKFFNALDDREKNDRLMELLEKIGALLQKDSKKGKWVLLIGAGTLVVTLIQFATPNAEQQMPDPEHTILHSISVNSTYSARGTVRATPLRASQGYPVELFAAPRDDDIYEFYFWESLSEYVIIENPHLANTSFLMVDREVAVKAHFRPRLFRITVDVNGENFGNAGARVSQAAFGYRVELYANGNGRYEFYNWRVLQGGVSVNDTSSENTFFIMPSSNVVVVANFREPLPPPTPSPAQPPPTLQPTPEPTPEPQRPGRDQWSDED